MARANHPIDEQGAVTPLSQSSPSNSTLMRSAALAIATLALGLLAACELVLAFPVPGWLYLAVGAFFAVGLLRPLTLRRQKYQVGALALVLAAIATLYFVEWSTRKPFLRDLARVQVGMSEADVRLVMARYKEGTGWPAVPTSPPSSSAKPEPAGELVLPHSLVFRHSDEAAFNSDWAIIALSEGRVAKVEFSAD
jgi:hypothetical protein